MTSSTVASPWSSLALIEIRFASGRDADVPAAQRVAGRAAAAVAGDQPGDVRAVAVLSSAVVRVRVGDRGGDDARARSRRRLRKSGRPPAMPVSITATPTPLPVAWFQTWGVLTDWL